MSLAAFEMVDHEREHGLALYYEDEYIALDTWDRKRSPGDHEILLDRTTVAFLIETLTNMQTTINARHPQKELTK